jgi:hypothetical protein
MDPSPLILISCILFFGLTLAIAKMIANAQHSIPVDLEVCDTSVFIPLTVVVTAEALLLKTSFITNETSIFSFKYGGFKTQIELVVSIAAAYVVYLRKLIPESSPPLQ